METNEERQLAKAVFKTINEQLDPPPYVFPDLSFEERDKLAKALGVATIYREVTSRGDKYHPLVIHYYKQWGDRYLDGLRASRRLLS